MAESRDAAEALSGTAATHGRIFDAEGGALHVHLHRDHGLAHRHLVLSSWQIRALRVLTSRAVLALVAVLLFGTAWISGQAARVPLLTREVATLTKELERVDSLTKTLGQLQANYERLRTMLGAGAVTSGDRAPASPPATTPSRSRPR